MAQTIKVENYSSLNTPAATLLDGDLAIGTSIIPVKNTDDFAIGDFVVLGRLGAGSSERCLVATVTPATSITLSVATTLIHKRFEPLTKLFGDQVKIYRANNTNGEVPSDAAYALLGSATTIDIPGLTTSYTDAMGGSSYWYKYTYFNSATSNETGLADSATQRGGGYGHYESIDAIRYEAGLQGNTSISDTLIDSRRIDGEDEVNAALLGSYTLPFPSPAPLLVAQANRLISAGLLLQTEYGIMAFGTDLVGTDKLEAGRALLLRLQNQELVLTDAAGNSLLTSSTVSSWPDATTDQTGSGYGPDTVAGNDQDYGPAVRKAMRF